MTLLLIALALLVVPALGVLVLRRSVAAGALLLFMLYTRISDVGIQYHGLPSIAQPFVLVLAAVVFARRTLTGGSRSLAAAWPQWCMMGLYLVVLYGSSIWAMDGGLATTQGTELLKNLLIVYIIAETFKDPRAQRLAVWALLAAGVLLAGLTVLQAVTHTYSNAYLGLAQAPVAQIVGKDNSVRSSGPVGDPNFYALILIALVPLALVRVRDERSLLLRLVALASTVLLFAAIILTYSRGALVTIGVMAVLFVWLIRMRARQLAGLLVVLACLAPLVPANYWSRIASLAQGDNSIQGRLGSEQVALSIFADHPLLGVGADNYQVTYFPYALRLNVPSAASHAHDLYLAVAAETGLLGLLAFGGAMLLVLAQTWRRRGDAWREGDRLGEGLATSSLLALGAYLLGCMFLPLAYPRYLWILVGLAVGVALPSERRSWDLLLRFDHKHLALPGPPAIRSRAAALHAGAVAAAQAAPAIPRAARRRARAAASAGTQLLRGSAISYASFVLGKALTFGSTVILARLLLPSDFGLVGYALLILSFLDVLKHFGVTYALIYRQDIGDDDAGEAFVLAVVTATMFSILCWILAPAAAQFFHNPRITLVTRVLGLSFVLDALGSVHATLLLKKMHYGRRFVPDLMQNLAKGALSVALALVGAGYWSLVWGQLAGIAAATVASWWLHPWWPRLRVRWASARRLLGYGLHVTLVDMVGAVILNADNVIVGRALGSAALGLYAFSFTIPQMLTISLTVAISNVAFPAFSRLQHDRAALRTGYLTVLRYSALVLLPVGLGFCAIVPAFVHGLYKPVWWPMVPVMQALTIYALVHAVGWNAGDVYKATGRPDLQWKLDLGQAVALIPALLIGAWADGILGVAVARIIIIMPYSAARFWLIRRILGVGGAGTIGALRVPVVAGLAMYLVCLLAGFLLAPVVAPPAVLLLQIAIGAVVYGVLALAMDQDLRAHVPPWLRVRRGSRASRLDALLNEPL